MTSHSLSNTSHVARFKSWYQKAKDSAVGTSFADHVIGGYRFLMRYYEADDDIFFFGFSRGAYVARFLAEMLDQIGLLTQGCEELVRFAWKTFAQWQQRQDGDGEEMKKKKEMFEYMRAFRETFSRPIRRIRFLGLFDTVNSVPRFEAAWMQRKKHPYTARSSAKVIRHAVSIDERRAKFRQDLISGIVPPHRKKAHQHVFHTKKPGIKKRRGPSVSKDGHLAVSGQGMPDPQKHSGQARARQSTAGLAPDNSSEAYRPRRRTLKAGSIADSAASSSAQSMSSVSMDDSTSQLSLQPQETADSDADSDGDVEQSIEELWFPGGHADIGGGWSLAPDERYSLSHVPLVWMVREARRAGLIFDEEKLRAFNCYDEADVNPASPTFSDPFARANELHVPSISIDPPSRTQTTEEVPTQTSEPVSEAMTAANSTSASDLHQALHTATSTGVIHDCLAYYNGLSHGSVLSWKVMEYLPFRRMDLQPDGSWKPIRWPLPCGEVRDIPREAKVHNSAIRRMQLDENYRPGNLIIGGGGRGVRKAPKEHGMGEWMVLREEGNPVGEVYRRKSVDDEEKV